MTDDDSHHQTRSAQTQRADKWLWYARFFKSRSSATTLVRAGRLRVNKMRVVKPNYRLRIGDVLTFSAGPHVRVVKVAALGTRRGPATEAQGLYEDLAPPAAADRPIAGPAGGKRDKGAGRPTKRDRRRIVGLTEKS